MLRASEGARVNITVHRITVDYVASRRFAPAVSGVALVGMCYQLVRGLAQQSLLPKDNLVHLTHKINERISNKLDLVDGSITAKIINTLNSYIVR
jgi:hypothetical protein